MIDTGNSPKQVAVIGAGKMVKPLVDYFIDTCKYKVILADINLEQPEKIINGRMLGKAVLWSTDEPESIDNIVKEADIVVSMVPKPIHIFVAKPCIRQGKSMITTSYEIPELMALNNEAKSKGIIILNEIGEDPGIDHLGTQMILDIIKAENAQLESLYTYGCGLPSLKHNTNPFGYKFSWDPVTFFKAAQSPAAYYIDGKRVEVPGDKLFENYSHLKIEGLGDFETYPNKDCKKYLDYFNLGHNITYYRGLLRYPGYCNNMNNLAGLDLFDDQEKHDFQGTTYKQFTESLIRESESNNLIKADNDFINKLEWLGLFENKKINIKSGTRLEMLKYLMLAKMTYLPDEQDMIIVHLEAVADFPGKGKEKIMATMKVEGIPYGDSAMSRAVALPAAIATRLILEGRITATGSQTPANQPMLYKPILKELAKFDYKFTVNRYKIQ